MRQRVAVAVCGRASCRACPRRLRSSGTRPSARRRGRSGLGSHASEGTPFGLRAARAAAIPRRVRSAWSRCGRKRGQGRPGAGRRRHSARRLRQPPDGARRAGEPRRTAPRTAGGARRRPSGPGRPGRRRRRGTGQSSRPDAESSSGRAGLRSARPGDLPYLQSYSWWLVHGAWCWCWESGPIAIGDPIGDRGWCSHRCSRPDSDYQSGPNRDSQSVWCSAPSGDWRSEGCNRPHRDRVGRVDARDPRECPCASTTRARALLVNPLNLGHDGRTEGTGGDGAVTP